MRLFYILLSVIFGCTTCNDNNLPPQNKSVVELNGQLSVQGTHLINTQGDTVMLKGVSYGWHNWWRRFYNDTSVTTFSTDWHCSVVRAAMGIEPDNAYLKNPDFAIKCVTKIVDSAIKNGIYVIIDWHSHHIKTQEAVAFFEKMASKYNAYPNIIYEIFNEPEGDVYTWQQVKEYSETVIKAIRTIDTKNLILVGSPHWDQDIHIAADNPITGYDNIMYTLHFYAATHKQNLRDKADYALNKGLPLFVSECAGMEATGNGPINYVEWQNWQNWMEKYSISWVAWSISDKDETCSMLHKTASSGGIWTDKDLKEWGKIIKTELSKTK
ncbi:MAG TPA: glycoside hydrolase family 5 protein [Paludibacter sp.]|nr:MAG: Endoglucanase 5A [Bacteroidetes bacterium ADurb.Bin174]HQB27550.1 glycoside hydrolase family 5 protein [Paludibacter sp.]